MSFLPDPYCYPGTSVLKNKKGLRSLTALARFEAVATARRLTELQAGLQIGPFTPAHLRSIHHHLFQDVYPWAGQFRTVDIAKPGSFWFARHDYVPSLVDDLCRQLAAERHLADTTPDAFAPRAAHYLGELNAIHPFREGNGRTQREFLRQLGFQAGHRLRWSHTTADEMTAASRASFEHGDNSLFTTLLRAALQQRFPT